MCTVTFIPRQTGYYLAMNRDEQLSRIAGLAPARRTMAGRTVISPREPGGGTWIAMNDSGSTVALINWYSANARVSGHAVSRGEVVDATSTGTSPDSVQALLAGLPLDRINPFRLIGIFPGEHGISEWTWDLKNLVQKKHRWKTRQWASSGFDERSAQRIRNQTFRKAQRQISTGTLDWLRRLHRSHSPGEGPFSVCMHRKDAATVSYTEIAVQSRRMAMHYHAAAPCHKNGFCQQLTLPRRQSRKT